MKKTTLFLCVMFLFFTFSNVALANLVTNGDFEDGTATVPFRDAFTLGSSAFGEWYAQSNWDVLPGGRTGAGDDFAMHILGTGDDQKLFQPIDTSAFDTTGAGLDFDFYAKFLEPDTGNPGALRVGLVGLSGAGAQYKSYGGSTIDGNYGSNTVLWTGSLTEWPSGDPDQWVHWTISTLTFSQNFDAIVVSFAGNGWLVGDGAFQAIDDVNLTISVPEPATLLLLGTGFLGFVVVGRKKFFKK